MLRCPVRCMIAMGSAPFSALTVIMPDRSECPPTRPTSSTPAKLSSRFVTWQITRSEVFERAGRGPVLAPSRDHARPQRVPADPPHVLDPRQAQQPLRHLANH